MWHLTQALSPDPADTASAQQVSRATGHSLVQTAHWVVLSARPGWQRQWGV